MSYLDVIKAGDAVSRRPDMPKVHSEVTDETFTYGDQMHLHNYLVTDNCEAETEEEAADELGEHSHVFIDDDGVECRTGEASNFDPHNHFHRLRPAAAPEEFIPYGMSPWENDHPE